MMLALSLIWLVVGLLIGIVAVAARLAPTRWARRQWLALPALGALAALAGGWLGALLLDRIFASFVAVCVGIAALLVVTLLARRWAVGSE